MTQRHASVRFTKNLHNVADPWTALQTFNAGIDITHADGITLQNDETIKNSTNGLISLSGNLAIPDGGTIGTASDTDAITIASAGAVTFSQGVTVTGNLLPGTDDTYDLGSASAAWQDLFLEGDITLTDAGSISTSAGALTLIPASDLIVTLNDDESGALAFNNSAVGYYIIDTRNASSGIVVHSFDSEDIALASSENSQDKIFKVKPITTTYTGGTRQTNESTTVDFDAMTFVGGSAITVDAATTLKLKAPIESTNVTMSVSSALHIVTTTGTPTRHHGILIDTLSGGVVSNSAITVGNTDADQEIIHLGVTGHPTFSWDESEDNFDFTHGVVINQAAGDDGMCLELRGGSDVTHGMTTSANTNTYLAIRKVGGDDGGAMLRGYSDAAIAIMLESNHTTEDDDKTSSANGSMQFNMRKISGTGGTSPGSNANLLVIDSDSTAMFLFDEEGSFYATANGHTGDVSVGALADSYDDAQLVRAFDHAKSADGAKGLIRDKWDEFIQYNEQDLVNAGVLGATLAEGGLLNVTGLQRLHNGAIWQGYVRQQEMQTRIESIENKLLALGA